MQIGTTGMNEGWHNALKTALGLARDQNSHYSLAGVIETFEDCARYVDHAYAKAQSKWKVRQLGLAFEQPWLKLFPFPAQIILAESFRDAKSHQFDVQARSLRPLDENDECYCQHFRKWNLPCDHMMELWLFSAQVNQQLDDAMEPNWEKYAAMFGD